MLRAPKQLWALETPNQKELKPPGAREREREREREIEREEEEKEEVICSPKGKQRCALPPASPEPDTKVGAGRKEKTAGSPVPSAPSREPGKRVPLSPPTLDAYRLLLKEAKEV